MLPKWQKGIVTRIEQANHNTRRYWLELPESPLFAFKPGQFVTLDLPIHEQRNKRWRSYSIASAPNGGNLIELVIVLVDDGLGSGYFFNNVAVGSELILRGPHGIFTLPAEIDKDIFMICTGTGIAPYRSILHYINEYKVPHKALHLIYGCRTREDLIYEDEMRALQQDIPELIYHITLSREDWEGAYKGYVHQVYEALCENRQPAHFMLCGWRNMVDEAKHRILEMGYDKNDIHLELYG
ncbi:MAG: oxidoreductase [Sphingobacteriales bacterium]|nr:MAG: oxidoreductase [Sphingobacteriales bacterium]